MCDFTSPGLQPSGHSAHWNSSQHIYNYFRDYDPNIGRYVESDPIGLSGGINTFGYVGGRPLFLADPMGLKVFISGHVAASPLGLFFPQKAYHTSLVLVRDCDGETTVLGGGPDIAVSINPGQGYQVGLNLVTKRDVRSDGFERSAFKQEVPTPNGQDDCEFIENIKRAANAYGNDLPYSFPGSDGLMSRRTYNSNSWTAGVLNAGGAAPGVMSNAQFSVPGFNNPIPIPSFKPAASGSGCCCKSR